MRKLNIKMLTTVSAVALSMAAASASAQDIELYQWLDDYDHNAISEWNEQFVEAALGAALVDATQIASIYLNEINNADIAAGNWAYFDQGYWVGDDSGDIEERNGIRLDSNNGAYALTTMNDALIDGLTQVATTAFQTASLTVVGEDSLTTIEIAQYTDGVDGYDYDRDVEFKMISDNEALAIAGFMGTAVIDGKVFDAELNDGEGGYANGIQQAINTLQSINVTADDGLDVELILSNGQNVDIEGVSETYWDDHYYNTSYYDSDLTVFAIDATNDAFAYAPHGVSISDPAVMNLDQVAAATINSITVGTEGGTADFAIYAGEDGDSYDYSTGQYANLFGGDNVDEAFYGLTFLEGPSVNPVNVRNSAVAITYGDELYGIGMADALPGDLTTDGEDYLYDLMGYGSNLESWNNDLNNLGYDDAYGDVTLSSLDQLASVSVNSISNRGDGDLTLKGTYDYWVDSYWGDSGIDFTDDRNFEQTVYFTFDGMDANSDSVYNYWYGDNDHPRGLINFALADTGTGDVTLDDVAQTTSFSFNTIRSVGDINGWTQLDEGVSSQIDQYAQVDIDLNNNDWYADSEGVGQAIFGYTDEGDMLAQDLSQTLAISMNSVSSNGDIRSDIYQDVGYYWDANVDIDVANYLQLDADNGDITGGGLSQVASFSANSIATRDLGDVLGGSLYTADIEQQGEDFDIDGDNMQNSIRIGENDWSDTVTLSDISQIYSISLNSIDVADDIVIGDADGEKFYGDQAYIWQEASENSFDAINELNVWASDLIALGSADTQSLQAATMSQNTIAAGGDISGADYARISQDADSMQSEYQDIWNAIYLESEDTTSLTNYAQIASLDVNTLSAGGDLSVQLYQESAYSDYYWDQPHFDLTNSVDVDSSADYGSVSDVLQQATINYATVDVTGNITGYIDQNSDEDDYHDFYLNNDINVAGYVDASISGSTQLAALNLNTVSAGGTISADYIGQEGYYGSDYIVDNYAYASSFEGVSSISDMAQVASINLNTVSADLYTSNGVDTLDIDQYADIGDSQFQIENTIYAISDMGSANINGIVQQAIARVNSISSPVDPIVD